MDFFVNADHGPFDPNRTDETRIRQDRQAVPCRICSDLFGRESLTFRYCTKCKRGFCDGIHGSYSQIGQAVGVCVVCFFRDRI